MPIVHQPVEVQVTEAPEEEEEDTDSEAQEQARMMGYEEEEETGGDQRSPPSRPRATAVQRAQSEVQPDSTGTKPSVQRSMSETRK